MPPRDLIRVNLDPRQLTGPLEQLQRQAPFIFALALTRTVQDAKGRIQGTLGDHFELRRKWVAQGIRVTPAKKTHLRAEVGSVDKFMEAHGVGGEVGPKEGSKSQAIPVGARPTPQSVTTPGQWPGRILARADKAAQRRAARGRKRRVGRHLKPKPFTAVINGAAGVYIRTGADRFPLKALWIFKKRIKQPKDWPFIETVQAVVDAAWRANVTRAMERALRTARPK